MRGATQVPTRTHRQLITNETLATAVELVALADFDGDPQAGEPAIVGDNESVRIRIEA